MKNHNKKLIAIVVAMFMLCMVLASCTQSSDTGTKDENNDETTEQKTDSEREHVTLSYVWTVWSPKTEYDDAVLDFYKDKFNCTIEKINIPSDVRSEKISIMWASGDKFTSSIGLPGTGNAQCLEVQYKNKWIQPIDEFIEKCPIMKRDIIPQCWAYVTCDDGKIYGVPEQGCSVKTGLWIRRDWLKALGLNEPKTIDELEIVMDAFKNKDPDNNGVDDTYGMTSYGGGFIAMQEYILGAFLPYGNSWQPIDDTDKIYPYFMHPDYKIYLKTIQDWVKRELIHPDQIMLKSDTSKAVWSQGQVGCFFAWYGDADAATSTLLAANPKADPWMLQSPKGISGKAGAMAKNLFGCALVFNKCATPAEVERFLEIVEYKCTSEGNAMNTCGVPGVHWIDNGDTIKLPEGATEKLYKGYYSLPGGAYTLAWRPVEGGVEASNEASKNCFKEIFESCKQYDYMFPYSWAGTKSESLISDLDKLIEQYINEICMGNKNVDYIDEGIEQWLKSGGDTYIDEYNEQYKVLKDKYGN